MISIHKIDRLAGIVFILGKKQKVQAKYLADAFEVSERTIYRDIQALQQLKVPVISETGGDGGYSIADNYFLQPIILTEEECQAVYLGCNFIQKQKGFPLSKSAERAIQKLDTIISKDKLEAANKILDKIVYKIYNIFAETYSEILSTIKKAIEEEKIVKISYVSISSNEITEREVEIYNLMYQNNSWYIEGYCYLRKGKRQFKVDRIKELYITEKGFEKERSFEIGRVNNNQRNEPAVITVTSNTITSRYIRENIALNSYIEEENELYFSLKLPPENFSNNYVIELLMRFGKDAVIEFPVELKEQFKRELHEVIKKYD